MKEPVLVIVKPDGVSRRLLGPIFSKLAETRLEILAVQWVKPNRARAEAHYRNIHGQPFFSDTVNFFLGKFHRKKCLLMLVYYGENAVQKCRKTAGATNPKEASPQTIRGAFGRVTPGGIYENVVHVSSDAKEAKREIQLWFEPEQILKKIYPTKIKTIYSARKRVWA